jgi:methylthioribulose-1-phosphate dehydratase
MSARSTELERLADELVAVSRSLHARGWALATSGNFSARIDASTILITASGLDKGELTTEGLLQVDLEGAVLSPSKAQPSAETALHTSLYRRYSGVGAVLHVHSPAATTLSMLSDEVRLSGWEMMKALARVTTHAHVEVVPVVENDQDTSRLAARAAERLDAAPASHAYLIAGHGLYTWGRSLSEARRHVEALEFLFDCELRRMAASRGSR